MKYLLLLAALPISLSLFGQQSSVLGFSLKAGTPHSRVRGINGYDVALQRSFGINMLSPGACFQKRFGSVALHAGAWYMRQSLRYKDEVVDPSGSLDLYGENFSIINKMRFAELDLGIRKDIGKSEKFRPFAGLDLTASFFATSALSSSASSNGSYSVESTFPSSMNFGLKPQIGIIARTGLWSEMSFSYSYHFGFSEILHGVYTATNSGGDVVSINTFISTGNYTGFTVSYHFILNQENPVKKQERLLAKQAKKASDTRYKGGKPVEHKGREVNVQNEITVQDTEIELYIWDSGAQEDGDSISIYVNDELVISNYGLSKEKTLVRIRIKTDQPNYVIIYAHNEGTEPPNTASVSYFTGSGDEKSFNIYSKINQSGAIKINYRPR